LLLLPGVWMLLLYPSCPSRSVPGACCFMPCRSRACYSLRVSWLGAGGCQGARRSCCCAPVLSPFPFASLSSFYFPRRPLVHVTRPYYPHATLHASILGYLPVARNARWHLPSTQAKLTQQSGSLPLVHSSTTHASQIFCGFSHSWQQVPQTSQVVYLCPQISVLLYMPQFRGVSQHVLLQSAMLLLPPCGSFLHLSVL
jgi:hypothetical protein